MTPRITPRDWQAISEYLDGRLDPKTRLNLEKRVQTQPELQTAVEEMRRTRLIIRSQPVRKAPRSFKLTRALVGSPVAVPRRGFYALRLASVAVIALLMVVIFGDVLTHSPLLSGVFVQQEASLQMAGEVPPQDDAALMMKAAPVEGEAQLKSLEVANPTSTPELPETPVSESVTPENARQAQPAGMAPPAGEAPAEAAEELPAPSGTPEEPLPGGETLSQYPAPAETEGQVSALEEPETAAYDQVSEIPPARVSRIQQVRNYLRPWLEISPGIIRAVEISLALIAFGLALGAWMIYRSVSKKE